MNDKNKPPSHNALLWLPENPDGKAALVKPLSWQNAPPKPKSNRRRCKRQAGDRSLSKMAANSRPLFHFSPPSSLFGNVVGGTLLKSQISSGGEGSRSLKTSSQKRTSNKQLTFGDRSRLSMRDQSGTGAHRHTSDTAVFSEVPTSQGDPRRQRAAPDKAAAKPKTPAGRGSKQKQGKPRFKITSSTARKKKPSVGKAATSSKNSSQRRGKGVTSAAAAALSVSYQNASGSAFLKHLNFRPIQNGRERSGGNSATDCAGSMSGEPGDVNYQGWMMSNASASSSSTSQDDADSSEGEAGMDETNHVNTSNGARESFEEAAPTTVKREMKNSEHRKLHSTAEASQTDSPAAVKSSDHFQNRTKQDSLGPQDVTPTSRGPESVQRGENSRATHSPVAREKAADRGAVDRDDELADQELQEMMGYHGDDDRSPQPQTTSRGAGAGSAKCGTPHVIRGAMSAKTSPTSGRGSNDGTMAQVSASQLSSESTSGTLSQALQSLDEVSRDRVQQEFNQRLGKYISMLCADSADSPAARRFQARILKHKSRASLSHIWASLASRIGRRGEAGSGAKADNAGGKLTKATSPITQDREENYSFNKKEDTDLAYDTRPPPSTRPHSSPARDIDLTSQALRIPTPSLRYLLKCAISTQPSQENSKQTETTLGNKTGAKPKQTVGGTPGQGQGFSMSGSQEVCSKPPAWRAVPQTDRTAQTDGTGCTCRHIPTSRTSPTGSGAFLTAPTSPSSLEVASFTPGNIHGEHTDGFRTPRTRTATPARISARSASQGKSPPAFRSAERHSSTGSFAAAKGSPGARTSPLMGIRRAGSLQDTPKAAGKASRLPPTPQGYKRGIPTNDVSFCVEADLEKYNAVMNRCRALLGEQDPDEDSSSWTHSSANGSPHTQTTVQSKQRTGDCASFDTKLCLNNTYQMEAGHAAADQSMGDIFADLKDCKADQIVVPPFTKPDEAGVPLAKPNKLIRSCSAQGAMDDRGTRSALALKRSSSNPHYLGIVEFGSEAAIRRLVDPVGAHCKPKVTFDIDSDKSGASLASGLGGATSLLIARIRDSASASAAIGADSTPQGPASRAKKSGLGRRKRTVTKSSGKPGQNSKLKTSSLKAGGKGPRVVEDGGEITPMRSRQPRTTNDRITSRKPLRTNPYYTSTLELKGKTLRTSPSPRPCSQTSWKTVDTDGTLRTPPPKMIDSSAEESSAHGKRKRRKLKKKVEGTGASETSHNRSLKFNKGKKKKKTALRINLAIPTEEAGDALPLKNKEARLDSQDEGFQNEPPPTTAHAVKKQHVGSARAAIAAAETQLTLVSLHCDDRKEKSFSSEPESLPTPQTPLTRKSEAGTEREIGYGSIESPSEKPPKPSHNGRGKTTGGDEKAAESSTSPKNHSIVSKSSPKVPSPRHRSASSGARKTSPKNGSFLAKNNHVGNHPYKKQLAAGVGSKAPWKQHTAMKRLGYRPAKLTGKSTASSDAAATSATEQPKSSDSSDDFVVATFSGEALEQYRRAFNAYKDIHPELVETSEELPARPKASVLRRAGPLVVALLIQLYVQYAYK